MPKGKLKINKADLKKFAFAAEFSDVKIGDSKKSGDEYLANVSFRSLQDVFALGRSLDKVSEEDIKAADAAAAKIAAAEKEKGKK